MSSLDTVLLIILTILLIYYFGALGVFVGIPTAILAATFDTRLALASPKYGAGDKPRTYVLDTKLVPQIFLDKYLGGWRQIPAKSRPKYVDFILCLSGGSRDLYNTRALLKHRVDSLEFTDKVNLHHHMEKINPNAIAKTVELTPQTEMPPGAVWMIRANWGWSGRASAVATSTAEMQKLREKYSVLPKDWKKPTPPRVIGSEYIQDPMLYKGYKFHVRVHIIGVVLTNRRYCAMLPSIYIILAGKPYVNGDWDDENIHDTHEARNTPFTFPAADMENGAELYEKTVDMMKEIMPQLIPMIKLYPESINAYDVFGVDIMFRRDGTPVLIEVNSTPGFFEEGDALRFINDEVTNAIFATAFSDLFYPAGDKSQLIMLDQ